MIETETRYQRIRREQRERQEARALRYAAGQKAKRRKHTKPSMFRYGDGSLSTYGSDARHGELSDDLGESPDF